MLTEYAEQELRRAGLLDKGSDYEGMLGEAVLALVRVFADQGHSGFSAGLTLEIFGKVARYEPLSALTTDPEEWMDVGNGQWQSRRQPSVFSHDGGQTAYDLDTDRAPVVLAPPRAATPPVREGAPDA